MLKCNFYGTTWNPYLSRLITTVMFYYLKQHLGVCSSLYPCYLDTMSFIYSFCQDSGEWLLNDLISCENHARGERKDGQRS